MKQKDCVRAFKNELRNYEIYRKEILKLDEQIEELYYHLGGVRGIDPSKEPLHTVPDKDLEYRLRDRISILEARKQVREEKIKQTDEVLGRIETTLRMALISVYAKGKTVDSIAIQMEISQTALIKRFNKAIERALR